MTNTIPILKEAGSFEHGVAPSAAQPDMSRLLLHPNALSKVQQAFSAAVCIAVWKGIMAKKCEGSEGSKTGLRVYSEKRKNRPGQKTAMTAHGRGVMGNERRIRAVKERVGGE